MSGYTYDHDGHTIDVRSQRCIKCACPLYGIDQFKLPCSKDSERKYDEEMKSLMEDPA